MLTTGKFEFEIKLWCSIDTSLHSKIDRNL